MSDSKGKMISTPRNNQGLYAMIQFYSQPDGNFVCAACGAVLPESILEEHVQRHTPSEPQVAAAPESVNQPLAQLSQEQGLCTTTRETPTDVLIRATMEIEKRKVDRVLVIQVSERNTWYSSNLSELELIGLLHEAFPRILQSLSRGEPREL